MTFSKQDNIEEENDEILKRTENSFGDSVSNNSENQEGVKRAFMESFGPTRNIQIQDQLRETFGQNRLGLGKNEMSFA